MNYQGSYTDTRIFCAAHVLAPGAATRTLQIELDGAKAIARIACPGPMPAAGGEVLVAGESHEDLFVIGVLTDCAPDGSLLFEYDAERKATRVHMPEGDLDLVAPQGGIRIQARDGMLLDASAVEIRGRRAVVLTVGGMLEKVRSRFALTRRGAAIRAERLNMNADRAELNFERTQIRGERARAEIKNVHVEGERLERTFDTVITNAKNAYESVEELSQQLVGRLRTIVSDAWHVRSKRTLLRSDENTQIDGKKIDLG
jgi:hypothetical protein